MTEIEIFIAVGLSLFVLIWLVGIILLFVRLARFRRNYFYLVNGHEVRVGLSMHSFYLNVDGRLEEQLSGSFRAFTLHATFDGAEFKAHVKVNVLRTEVKAVYAEKEVAPYSVTK